MEAFALFVCQAHSWYKHLPTLPPGRPFRFFLDPAAGMQLMLDRDGKASAVERLERGFHRSWIPTAQYRERFGHLAYSRDVGTLVGLQRADGTRLVGSDDEAAIFDPTTGLSNGLPEEVITAGTLMVSGLVHSLGIRHFCGQIMGRMRADQWPEESGGVAQFNAIRARCEELRKDPLKAEYPPPEAKDADINLVWVDWRLHLLIEKERARQRAEMVGAMVRVADLANVR